MPGPQAKPAHLRQRRNKKPSAAELSAPVTARVPPIPNPDPKARKWHRLTRVWWRHIWESPMSTRYLQTDIDALGMIALMVDDYYKAPDAKVLSEIRLQASRFGLSPWDRQKLEWRIADEPEDQRRQPQQAVSGSDADPRKLLKAVK